MNQNMLFGIANLLKTVEVEKVIKYLIIPVFSLILNSLLPLK